MKNRHFPSDGPLALQMILEHQPQVALLDIGLPRMNGYLLATAIREKLGTGVKLVAMSGYGQADDVRNAHAAGFDRHLTKPVDPRRLATALRDINAADLPRASRPFSRESTSATCIPSR